MDDVLLGTRVGEYRSAVAGLRRSVDDAARSVADVVAAEAQVTATDEDLPVPAPLADLGAAVDRVLEAGAAAERVIFADPHHPEAPQRLMALTSADLGVLAELVELIDLDDEPGSDPVIALADGAGAAAAIEVSIEGVLGAPPPGHLDLVELAQATPAERVTGAIDRMVTDASERTTAVIGAAVWPSSDQLVGFVGNVFGDGPAELLGAVFDRISRWKRWVLDGVKKIIAAVVDRLSRMFGKAVTGAIVDRVKGWLTELLESVDVLGRLLGVDALAAVCTDALGSAADARVRADRVEAVALHHADAQEWIGYGVGAIKVGKFFELDTWTPAGPVLIGTLAAALLLASGWLVNDHLDARTLPLPDLTIGVRTICLGGAA